MIDKLDETVLDVQLHLDPVTVTKSGLPSEKVSSFTWRPLSFLKDQLKLKLTFKHPILLARNN